MPVTSYSRTPSSNNSAPPNGAPEGMVFSAVNDTLRQLMTDTVQEAAKGQARVLASVSGTNTITATMTPDLDAYTAGMIVVFTPANDNTGATTLNIDSLGALDILDGRGSALVGGELIAGVPTVLTLDAGADDWVISSLHSSYGTATLTLTGCTTSPTVLCSYIKVGKLYHFTATGAVSGTSSSTAMTLTGLPFACYAQGAVFIIDNGAYEIGYLTVSGGTTISFSRNALASFTSSGTKGVNGFSFSARALS